MVDKDISSQEVSLVWLDISGAHCWQEDYLTQEKTKQCLHMLQNEFQVNKSCKYQYKINKKAFNNTSLQDRKPRH